MLKLQLLGQQWNMHPMGLAAAFWITMMAE
jgi:hypothetical protein